MFREMLDLHDWVSSEMMNNDSRTGNGFDFFGDTQNLWWNGTITDKFAVVVETTLLPFHDYSTPLVSAKGIVSPKSESHTESTETKNSLQVNDVVASQGAHVAPHS